VTENKRGCGQKFPAAGLIEYQRHPLFLPFGLNRIAAPRDGLMRRETPQPGATPESSLARLKTG
jgi:hypothetical protein